MDSARFRLGYVANCLSLGLTASHTCRLAHATPARIEELLAQNLIELEAILLFNEEQRIQVFRIGSALVPFGSHPVNRARWWQTFRRDFERIGRIASRSGQRLSMHPGPEAASLASAHPSVRERAERELRYSTRVLDLLGQGRQARVVLHLGGAAPDPGSALDAAHRFLDRVPHDARRRLALEHDDRIWPARVVLPLAVEHGLPFVADTLHNAVLPSTPVVPLPELLATAARTWHRLGLRPKHHVASQRPNGRPGAHAVHVPLRELLPVIAGLHDDADLMLEAKGKDEALLRLRRELRRAAIHDEELLRSRPRQEAFGVMNAASSE